MNARVMELYRLHDYFNEMDFSNKLMKIRMLLKRNRKKEGEYEWFSRVRNGNKNMPDRERLQEATISISSICFSKEGKLEGAILHEMVHQYQTEVLDSDTVHNAIFKSICRHLERKYEIEVR